MSWNPEAGPHHAKLLALVGTWEGVELLHPSPWGPGGPAVGRFVNRADIEGFFVISDYEEVKDGEVTFRGHGVYGWDELSKCYVLYWFDTMGMAPPAPARGQWEGNTLTLLLSQPGAQVRYTHVFEREGEYRFRLESKRDGDDWKTLMDAGYLRIA